MVDPRNRVCGLALLIPCISQGWTNPQTRFLGWSTKIHQVVLASSSSSGRLHSQRHFLQLRRPQRSEESTRKKRRFNVDIWFIYIYIYMMYDIYIYIYHIYIHNIKTYTYTYIYIYICICDIWYLGPLCIIVYMFCFYYCYYWQCFCLNIILFMFMI